MCKHLSRTATEKSKGIEKRGWDNIIPLLSILGLLGQHMLPSSAVALQQAQAQSHCENHDWRFQYI